MLARSAAGVITVASDDAWGKSAAWHRTHTTTGVADMSIFRRTLADSRPRMDRYALVKRTLDYAVALLAVLLTLPVWAAVALAIKLDSRGPVFFRQTRVGKDGRLFTVYKFRTMHVNNDDSIHRAYMAALMADGEASEMVNGTPVFKLQNDPRVTRAGRILRKTSLDELPQLLNVLRGEMSLVGPRPALPYEVEQYQPWQRARLNATPGITGLWQVYGRSRVTFEEMVRMDITYTETRSLGQDLKLIVLTVPVMVFGIGGA